MNSEKKREIIRTIKFALFSASAGAIQIGSFALLNLLTALPYWCEYLISLVLSVLWNFTLNRRYTFHSANHIPTAMLKVFGYYCVFTPLSTILGNWLVEALCWNEFLTEAVSMIINFITEFIFDRFFVFRDSIDTNTVAKAKNKSV